MNWIVSDDDKIGNATLRFPVGIYMEGYTDIGATLADKLTTFNGIGVDHVFKPLASTFAGDQTFINKIEELDMKVIVESNDPNGLDPDANPSDYGGFTAIFNEFGTDWCAGIQCYDDMETHANAATRYAALAAAFPDIPIYGSGESVTAGTNLTRRQQCDIMAQQNYPVGQEDIIPASVRRYAGARTSGKALIGNAQYFAWSGQSLPTADEFEAMLYLAAIYCDGVTVYTGYNASIYGNSIDLVAASSYMQKLESFITWVRSVEDYLTEGTRVITTEGGSGTETKATATWTLNGSSISASVEEVTVTSLTIEKS